MVDSLTQNAGLVLFLWVLANQAGVPVPAVPSLLAAGVLASRGSLSFIVILAVVVGGALSADLLWYSLGRWRGARALAVLRRFRTPRASTDRIERFFLTHRFGFLWSARFLPELRRVVNPWKPRSVGHSADPASRGKGI